MYLWRENEIWILAVEATQGRTAEFKFYFPAKCTQVQKADFHKIISLKFYGVNIILTVAVLYLNVTLQVDQSRQNLFYLYKTFD